VDRDATFGSLGGWEAKIMDDIDDLPLFQPTPLQRRLIDAAVEIEECTPDTVEFLHAVLCQVGLPRRVTKERVFERNNGRASIRVEAGALYKGGKWIDQPLPCGAKPRLALIHVSSEAVRTKSRTVEVGESIAEFLRLLDLPTTGAAYAEMKRQMERLAACNMMLGMSGPSRDVTVSAKPIERFEAWLQYDGRQRSMWPGVLDLSQPFFETLISHAVPLDPRAIHGLKKIGSCPRRLQLAGAPAVPGAEGGRGQTVVGQSAPAIRAGIPLLEGLQKGIPSGAAESPGGLSGCPD
jgi:replication initiator protein